MTTRFVLVHSPIVGPDTWEPVADELRDLGHEAIVPVLSDDGTSPYWTAHVRSVVDAVTGPSTDQRPVTVAAHSGAGQLLGLIGQGLAERDHLVAAYLFVDAGLPTEGRSRVAQLRDEAPAFADELAALLAAGRRFPPWTDEMLAPLVPDPERRRRLVAGIRRLPEAYWSEPIPAAPGWPDAPCGVLLLSGGYEATADAAERAGWPLRRLETANHFFALVEPGTLARELVALSVATAAR